MNYVKTFPIGDRPQIHLCGNGDMTACGHDIAGDPNVHRKDPQVMRGKPRITCTHCADLIALVREHLANTQLRNAGGGDASQTL